MFFIELNDSKYSFEKFTYTKEYNDYSRVEILDLYPYKDDDADAADGKDKDKGVVGNEVIDPSEVGLYKGKEVNFKLHFKMSRFTYTDRHGAEAVAFEGIDTAMDKDAAPLLTYNGLIKTVETLYTNYRRKKEFRLVITDEFAGGSNTTNEIFDMPTDNDNARNISKTVTQPMNKVTNPDPKSKLVSADMFPKGSTSSSVIVTSRTKDVSYATSRDYAFSIYDTQRPKEGSESLFGGVDATVEIKRIGMDRLNTHDEYHLTLPQDVKSGKTTLILNRVRQIARNNVVYDGSMAINPIEYYKDLAMSKTGKEDKDKAKMRGNAFQLLDSDKKSNPSDSNGRNALPTMYSPFEFNEDKQDAKAKVLGRKDYKIFERSEYEMQFASIPSVTIDYLTEKEAKDIEKQLEGKDGKVTVFDETTVDSLWNIGYANMGCVICKRRFVKDGEGICNSYIKLSKTPIIRDLGPIYPIDPNDREWTGWENHPCRRMEKVATEFIKKVARALGFNYADREKAGGVNAPKDEYKRSKLTDKIVKEKKYAWVYDDTGDEKNQPSYKPKITQPFAEALYATLHWGTIIDHGFACSQVCSGPLANTDGDKYPRAADGFKSCWYSVYNPFNGTDPAPVFCNQVSDGSDPCQIGSADCHYAQTQQYGGGSGKHQGLYNVYERQDKREADLYAYFIWQNGDVIVTESARKTLNIEANLKRTDLTGGMTGVNFYKQGVPEEEIIGDNDEVLVPTRVMEMVGGPDEFFSDSKSDRWKFWEGRYNEKTKKHDYYHEDVESDVYKYTRDKMGSFWLMPKEYVNAYLAGEWPDKVPREKKDGKGDIIYRDKSTKTDPVIEIVDNPKGFYIEGSYYQGRVVADPPGPPDVVYNENERIVKDKNGNSYRTAAKRYFFECTDKNLDTFRISDFTDEPFVGNMYSRVHNKKGTVGARCVEKKKWKMYPEGAKKWPTWRQRYDYYLQTKKIKPVWVFARPEMLGLIYPNGEKAGQYFNLFKEFPSDNPNDIIAGSTVLVDGSELKSNGRYNSFHASVLDWLADGQIAEIGLRQSKINLQNSSLRNDPPFEDYYYWRCYDDFTTRKRNNLSPTDPVPEAAKRFNTGTTYEHLSPGYNPSDKRNNDKPWSERLFSYTSVNPIIRHGNTPSGLENESAQDPQWEAEDRRNLHPFKSWSVLHIDQYPRDVPKDHPHNELDNYHYITHTVGETYGPHTGAGMSFNNSVRDPFGVQGHRYEHSYTWSAQWHERSEEVKQKKYTYIHERMVPAVFDAVNRARLLEQNFKVTDEEPPIPGSTDRDLENRLKKEDDINRNVKVQGFFDKFPLDFISFDNEMPLFVAPKKKHDYILKRIVTEISNSNLDKQANKEFLKNAYMKQFERVTPLNGPSESLKMIRQDYDGKIMTYDERTGDQKEYEYKYDDSKDSKPYSIDRVSSQASGAILKRYNATGTIIKPINADGKPFEAGFGSKLPDPHTFGKLTMQKGVASTEKSDIRVDTIAQDDYKKKLLKDNKIVKGYKSGYNSLGLQSQRQDSIEVTDYRLTDTGHGFTDDSGHALMTDDFSGITTTLTVAPAATEDRGDFVEDKLRMGIGDYEDKIK